LPPLSSPRTAVYVGFVVIVVLIVLVVNIIVVVIVVVVFLIVLFVVFVVLVILFVVLLIVIVVVFVVFVVVIIVVVFVVVYELLSPQATATVSLLQILVDCCLCPRPLLLLPLSSPPTAVAVNLAAATTIASPVTRRDYARWVRR
jgi:hypothetical protein